MAYLADATAGAVAVAALGATVNASAEITQDDTGNWSRYVGNDATIALDNITNASAGAAVVAGLAVEIGRCGFFRLFEEFAGQFGKSIHDLANGGDIIKVALINDTLEPTQAASAVWGTYSGNEVSGTGYDAGGATLANQSYTEAAGTATFDADNVTWYENAAGPEDARYIIIYNDSDAIGPDSAIGWMDLGHLTSLRKGHMIIDWAATGICRFTDQDLSP